MGRPHLPGAAGLTALAFVGADPGSFFTMVVVVVVVTVVVVVVGW